MGKKRAVLLSVVGAATYKTLRNILSPEKPGEKTYTELVEKLARHFKPAPSEIVERFKFHSRVRRAGESITTYVAELRSLSEYCNFGAMLNDMLRDRLVCGVNDGAIQKTLLAQVALTYEKAAELALNAEAATQSMRELGLRSESGSFSRPTPQVVHKTDATDAAMGASQGSPTCYRCGFRGHTADKCRVNSHQCGKRGHLRRAPVSLSRGTSPRRLVGWNKRTRGKRKTYRVRGRETPGSYPLPNQVSWGDRCTTNHCESEAGRLPSGHGGGHRCLYLFDVRVCFHQVVAREELGPFSSEASNIPQGAYPCGGLL